MYKSFRARRRKLHKTVLVAKRYCEIHKYQTKTSCQKDIEYFQNCVEKCSREYKKTSHQLYAETEEPEILDHELKRNQKFDADVAYSVAVLKSIFWLLKEDLVLDGSLSINQLPPCPSKPCSPRSNGSSNSSETSSLVNIKTCLSISKPELPSICVPHQLSSDWNLNPTTSVLNTNTIIDTSLNPPNEDEIEIELGETDMIFSEPENETNISDKNDENDSQLELFHFSPKENLIITVDVAPLIHPEQQATNSQCHEVANHGINQFGKSISATQNLSVRGRRRRGGKKKFKPLKYACGFCNELHLGYRCRQFLELSTTERCALIQTKALCLLCFKPKHEICNYGLCNKCNGAHHSVLHQDNLADEDQLMEEIAKNPAFNLQRKPAYQRTFDSSDELN